MKFEPAKSACTVCTYLNREIEYNRTSYDILTLSSWKGTISITSNQAIMILWNFEFYSEFPRKSLYYSMLQNFAFY